MEYIKDFVFNVTGFNTENVEDMSEMFSYCTMISEINLQNFIIPRTKC